MIRPPPAAPAAVGGTHLGALSRWLVARPPFARITSLAALVITVSSTLDAFSATPTTLGRTWVWTWAGVALVVTVLPLLLGRRFPRWAGLLAAGVFLTVTAVQVAVSSSTTETVTAVILHPMVACYLGWFFGRRTAWTTFLLGVAATTVALLANPQPRLGTTWGNLVVASAFCLVAISYLHRGLERQARTDPLTGALNRAGFTDLAGRALESAARTSRPVALILLDLDEFKLVNDRDGHAEGDRVLVDLVATVVASTAPGDAVARLGGDEFAILLRETSSVEAYQRVADLQDTSAVPWSYGVALSAPEDTLDSVLERADAALYAIKRQRRAQRTQPEVPAPIEVAPLPPA